MFSWWLASHSVSLRSPPSTVAMDPSQSDVDPQWSEEQREFCVEQYYLHHGLTAPVKHLYCEKFGVVNSEIPLCPTSGRIKQWVRIHENNHRPEQAEEQQKTEPSKENVEQEPVLVQHQPNVSTTKPLEKLSGSQWGRKTGENRIVRTESIDIGQQHQAMKWRQRDIKWSGPRPVNEKEKVIVKPVEEQHNYYYYNYQEPIEEEVKPDKKQVIQEKFEENVLELVEALNARGHAARATAFVSLRAALQRRPVDSLLAAHRATLADHVSRALRRGKDAERKAAAAIAPLLALQIGEEGTEEFVREVRPALAATATDKSASLDTRIECCSSLAVLSYLMEDDLFEIIETMRMYETIFSGSYLKTVTDDDDSDNALSAHVDALLPRLTELARDSHKFRAKRDRKIQRATFRDILKFFEEGEVPRMSVRIGTESVSYSSWSRGAAHAALAHALGGALQVLAPRCARLRAALELAEELPMEAEKLNKLQRHLQNRAACKARHIVRNRNRDKRTVVFAS